MNAPKSDSVELIYCNICRRKTRHQNPPKCFSERSEAEQAYEGTPYEETVFAELWQYRMWVCQGCNTAVLEEAYNNWDMVDIESGEYTWEVAFYPAREGEYRLPDPQAHMPPDVRADYEEARSVFLHSPRSAAALLRLAIEKLCRKLCEELRKEGKSTKHGSLNRNIGTLVESGLSLQIQRALDTVRVMGNEAVHPGKIDVGDDPRTAAELFRLVNWIVEDQIAKKVEINRLYKSLPKDKLKGIEQRDHS